MSSSSKSLLVSMLGVGNGEVAGGGSRKAWEDELRGKAPARRLSVSVGGDSSPE